MVKPLRVVPSRIELESGASETPILSIVLQDRVLGNGQQNYGKKFTYSNHTGLSQNFFDGIQ